MIAPWNAAWSAEDSYQIRPCRWVGGKLAIWSPHKPGEGRPIFAKPHIVRQRQSVARFLCTVCGVATRTRDSQGEVSAASVHRCLRRRCPHLRGRSGDLRPFPSGYSVLTALVGGMAVERDFGVRISVDRPVVGHLKFAWPAALIKGVA